MNNVLKILLELLYPKRTTCLICEFETKGILCENCVSAIKFICGRTCFRCGKELDDKYMENLCPDCKHTSHHFDSAYSCFLYEGMGKELIHIFKYNGRQKVAKLLACYMYEKIKDEGLTGDLIIPVPIYESKRIKRGFNQSALMGKELSSLSGIQFLDTLIRVKDTEKQYNLSRNDRFSNVFGAFAGKGEYDIRGKDILLIDDVYTTGSTVDECSRVLKRLGAQKILVITAASGKNT